jgi:hypothetical protein
VRADLSIATDRLEAGEYEPTPGPWCRRCDFVDVCPAGQREVSM